MRTSVVLTVSESKRLIARGVAAMPLVQKALADGTIAVAKGTTNGYVAEELLGKSIDKLRYVTGRTLPRKSPPARKIDSSAPDIVLTKGQPVEGTTVTDAVTKMEVGDVFIKGVNALNYDLDQVGILIGHPQGGTIGAAIGHAYGRRVQLLFPVGLEKSIAGDLHELSQWTREADESTTPRLWVVDGIIFTEIEAVDVLTGARAFPIGSGGIAGAEGAVWLGIDGTPDQVKAATDLLDSIAGEPPFV